MQRKEFIQTSIALTAGALLSKPTEALAFTNFIKPVDATNEPHGLVILHTNDVHSRLDPFPMDGGKYEGKGGVSKRKAIIDAVRAKHKNVLLLDSGDIFQGTPYFNIYKGEPEIKAMSFMGYDACTMGNHDFDGGLDNFAKQLDHANFKVLVCNYDCTNTALENKVKPYTIIKKGGYKIGILGVGIELKGLVPDSLCAGIKYLDPIENANKYAAILKHKKKCDMVICLSHLGFKYTNEKISDNTLALASKNIDLILGGHTHTFLDEPLKLKNADNATILINQVGWGGIQLGCLYFDFIHKNGKRKSHKSHTVFTVE